MKVSSNVLLRFFCSIPPSSFSALFSFSVMVITYLVSLFPEGKQINELRVTGHIIPNAQVTTKLMHEKRQHFVAWLFLPLMLLTPIAANEQTPSTPITKVGIFPNHNVLVQFNETNPRVPRCGNVSMIKCGGQ